MSEINSFLDRPLCAIDIEATGTDIAADRIVSLAIVRLTPPDLFTSTSESAFDQIGWMNAARDVRVWLVNPGRLIPADSTRVHGLTDAMVHGCPPFINVAAEVQQFLAGADLCGYSARRFDVPLLWEEFFRAGISWDLAEVKIIDPAVIFHRREPRTLAAAVKKFCGREHADAHEALADARAALDVMIGQRAYYEDLRECNVNALAELSSQEEWEGLPAKNLDLAGFIIEDANGIARYTLKKVRGVPVSDDPGFGAWMLRNDFPEHTKRVLRRILDNEMF